MGIQTLLTQIKPYAKDIKISLKKIFVDYETPGLSREEVWTSGLVVAYTLRNSQLIDYFETYVLENSKEKNIEKYFETLKALITVMTIKNTYNKAILKSQNIELENFEINMSDDVLEIHEVLTDKHFNMYALASAAVSASQICMQEQICTLRELGVQVETIHSLISIAAIVKGTSQALNMN